MSDPDRIAALEARVAALEAMFPPLTEEEREKRRERAREIAAQFQKQFQKMNAILAHMRNPPF